VKLIKVGFQLKKHGRWKFLNTRINTSTSSLRLFDNLNQKIIIDLPLRFNFGLTMIWQEKDDNLFVLAEIIVHTDGLEIFFNNNLGGKVGHPLSSRVGC